MKTLSIFIILLLNFISSTAMDKKKEIVSENKLRAILNATATQDSIKQTAAVPKKEQVPTKQAAVATKKEDNRYKEKDPKGIVFACKPNIDQKKKEPKKKVIFADKPVILNEKPNLENQVSKQDEVTVKQENEIEKPITSFEQACKILMLLRANHAGTIKLSHGYLLNLKDEKIKNLSQSVPDLIKLTTPHVAAKMGGMESVRALLEDTEVRSWVYPKRVNLSNNRFETIPDELKQLTGLKRLIMTDNNISSIPASIALFTQLARLNLENNQIALLPEEIGQLISLKLLRLNENKLTTVPGSLANLTNLQKLELMENPIEALPNALTNLKDLTEIHISTAHRDFSVYTNFKLLASVVKDFPDTFKFTIQ